MQPTITEPPATERRRPPPHEPFPGTKPRMLLIVNPCATTVSGRLKNLVVYALRGRYDIEAVETQRPNHATDADPRGGRRGFRPGRVAFGGDGTLNEAANGLAGSSVPLSMLPGGCTNVVCRMLGIPTDVVDATEHLLQLADDLEPAAIDLGRVNGRYFVFSSGAGIDADATRWVDDHPRLKARGGDATFTLRGAAAATSATTAAVRRCLEVAGRRRSASRAQRDRPELGPVHVLPLHPAARVRGHRDGQRHDLRHDDAPRLADLDAPGILWRLFSRDGAASRSTGRPRASRASSARRSRSLERPAAARSRSTATTSATATEAVYERGARRAAGRRLAGVRHAHCSCCGRGAAGGFDTGVGHAGASIGTAPVDDACGLQASTFTRGAKETCRWPMRDTDVDPPSLTYYALVVGTSQDHAGRQLLTPTPVSATPDACAREADCRGLKNVAGKYAYAVASDARVGVRQSTRRVRCGAL